MKWGLVPLLCLAVLALAPAAARAVTCGVPADGAPKADIAGWMAEGAAGAGLPGELPVMASLVDAGLRNGPTGDADRVGYFAMRVSIWNRAPYLGFPDNPALQLQWFVDQALAAKARRVAAGDANFGSDPSQWGEWVADVMLPPEQFRGRYQLRLDEARQLIALGCAAAAPTAPSVPMTPSAPATPGTAPTNPAPTNPAPAPGAKGDPRLQLSHVSRSGRRIRVTGRISTKASGWVTVRYRAGGGGRTRTLERRATLRAGRYTVTLILSRTLARARTGTVTVRYAGDGDTRAATTTAAVRLGRA
jgi:hypothetical protein